MVIMMMKMIMEMIMLMTVNHYNRQNGNNLRKSSIHNALGYRNNASERALSATLLTIYFKSCSKTTNTNVALNTKYKLHITN